MTNHRTINARKRTVSGAFMQVWVLTGTKPEKVYF